MKRISRNPKEAIDQIIISLSETLNNDTIVIDSEENYSIFDNIETFSLTEYLRREFGFKKYGNIHYAIQSLENGLISLFIYYLTGSDEKNLKFLERFQDIGFFPETDIEDFINQLKEISDFLEKAGS